MRLLRQHVRTDSLLGVDSLPIAPPGQDTPNQSAPAGRASVTSTQPTRMARSSQPPAGQADKQPSRSTGALRQANLPAVSLSTEEKTRLLADLDREQVSVCTKCELCHARSQTVFGEGSVDAPIMFVGEGPGAEEDEAGRPFVGRSGQLLTKMIAAIGYEREQVYIANVVKCRPPGNRTPTPAEAQTCWPYLLRQIAIIRPRVIVTLGGPAMKQLLGTREGVTRLRGTWHKFTAVEPAIDVIPTFHPSYVLRSYTPENRRKVWEDLQAAAKAAQ